MKYYNWGIIAPGNIAESFATALSGVERARLYSVASRSVDRATTFANEHGFQKVAHSYAELLQDPSVDVIYIASPHNFHMQQSLDCLEAGKAVLCEKPMCVNALEAAKVFDMAEQKRVFYMEAVWTRFMPVYRQIRAWLEQGKIGQVQMIQASFGFSFADKRSPDSRLLNLDLAGGALLDLGIYPITFAQWVMRQAPIEIVARGNLGKTGVDEKTAMLMTYSNNEMAVLSTTLSADTSYDAWILGSEGRIKVPVFWCAESAELFTNHGNERAEAPHAVNGYEWEIEEVHACLDAGLLESRQMPWSTSLETMRIMDEVRAQIGLRYPMEN
ncbi:MAG: dihydrodiol dehydrogenase / D-xylose 1-dehydrogenase (NADP) [Pseudoalteromonas tetraodonis]|jgi:dihydrodiol dehydrogenase / D-xylose 1-dehydrogenase (NADP)